MKEFTFDDLESKKPSGYGIPAQHFEQVVGKTLNKKLKDGHLSIGRISINKRKICVVITARPSYSRVKSALHAIDNHPDLELQIVVADLPYYLGTVVLSII